MAKKKKITTKRKKKEAKPSKSIYSNRRLDLKEILENHSKQGEFTLAMAFGPGLTTETVLLKHV